MAGALSLAIGMAGGAVAADEGATPQEVVAKVHEAATYLEENGEAGLALFDKAKSPFVWKDSYVFVLDCPADVIAAHPIEGTKGLAISTLEDVDGRDFGRLMCEASAQPDGSWVVYKWPKPVADDGADQLAEASEASRKVAFILKVAGTPYTVGAGDYDDTLAVEDLEGLLAN
ncbi:MAG: calcium:proton antiporter [Hyphomicrobiales bacterium]|nr:calcium:proton antiporter [Hyphomicrobiales bacterium]